VSSLTEKLFYYDALAWFRSKTFWNTNNLKQQKKLKTPRIKSKMHKANGNGTGNNKTRSKFDS
jgi:hypothetical protein